MFLFGLKADYHCYNSSAAIWINGIMTDWMLQWKGARLWSDQSKHATVFLLLSPWDQSVGRLKGRRDMAFDAATVVFERVCPYLLCVKDALSEWNSTAASVQVMQSEGMQTVGYLEIYLCTLCRNPRARRLHVCAHQTGAKKKFNSSPHECSKNHGTRQSYSTSECF